MGVIDSIKNIFSNKDKENVQIERYDKWIDNANTNKENVDNNHDEIEVFINEIDISPNLYLAHRAGRICVGKTPIEGTINDRMAHVKGMLSKGHESVTEHTNAIFVFRFFKKDINNHIADFSEILANLKYCHFVTKDDNEFLNILIGGSVRAYYYLVRETNQSNIFLQAVKHILCSSFEKCLLTPLIKLGMIDETECDFISKAKIKEVPSSVTQVKNHFERTDTENYDMEVEDINAREIDSGHVIFIEQTPLAEIVNKVAKFGFTFKDACRVATVSFIFHNVSRSCSHQLVRHRNGISQESQRYTYHEYKYPNEEFFIDPISNSPRYAGDEFDKVKEKIAKADVFNLYNYLISNKIFKEDARAFLPTNVTTQLMMTFTYENYAYFLKLRLDKAAQKEIRDIAEESYKHIFTEDNIEYFINLLTDKSINKEDKIDPLMKLFPDFDSIDDEMGDLKVDNIEDAEKILKMDDKLKES